jgi:hypothetical protein
LQGILWYIRASFFAYGATSIVIFTAAFYVLKRLFKKSFKKIPGAEIVIACSLLLGFLIISFVPNKDARYIYPFVVLSLLFSSWVVARLAPKPVVGFLGVFIVLVFIGRIFLSYPRPEKEAYLLSRAAVLLKDYKATKVYYFFEDDSPFFNYSNVALAHQFLSVDFRFLNENSIDSQVNQTGTCGFEEFPATVLVYSYSLFKGEYPDKHVDFGSYCLDADVLKECSLKKVEYSTFGERLKVYGCGETTEVQGATGNDKSSYGTWYNTP